MKNKRFTSFITLLLLATVSLVGCDNNHNNQNDTQALTENDFAAEPSLRANPEGGVVVTFLEHPMSDTPDNDTGEIGIDIIPYTYNRTLEHTFCWKDDDGEAGHFMELRDSGGNEIFRLDANGECVTAILEAGDYTMHLRHDGRAETTYPIFMIPESGGEQGAKNDDSVSEGILAVLYGILDKLDIGFTQTTNAQTVEENRATLLKTNSCAGCLLFEAFLKGANLSGADLSSATLSGAVLFEAILTNANLNLADLRNAFMSIADLTNANLSFAILSGADLFGVTLTNANLSLATWCDGCLCADNSIGTCVGCPSVDICTGSQ